MSTVWDNINIDIIFFCVLKFSRESKESYCLLLIIFLRGEKMVFNKEITGYENEEEFASYLNGNQVGRVYPNFLELLLNFNGSVENLVIL